MSTFYTTFLSKSDFSFVLLLITFEPLEVEQSYIALLKALMCGINAVGDQGCGCKFTFCHALLKIVVLLHKMPKVPFILVLAVYFINPFRPLCKNSKGNFGNWKFSIKNLTHYIILMDWWIQQIRGDHFQQQRDVCLPRNHFSEALTNYLC